MNKAIPTHLTLDDEVVTLIHRLAVTGAVADHTKEYTVTRTPRGVTLVTVVLIADEHFSSSAGSA